MKRIAIFASGTGSNAKKITDYFKEQAKDISIALIVSNNPKAGALKVAEESGIKSILVTREIFNQPEHLLEMLAKEQIDFIVLAGFLWLIPKKVISRFKGKIVNIHPALLPKYGGKGMYGITVHEAVKAAGEKETGITIHFVDENFDEGKIIFQKKCIIKEQDTPENISLKVRELEHKYYPLIIKSLLEE